MVIICFKKQKWKHQLFKLRGKKKNLLTFKNKSSPKGKSESIAGLFRQKKEQMHKLLALLKHSVYKTFSAVFPCQLKVSIGFTFPF